MFDRLQFVPLSNVHNDINDKTLFLVFQLEFMSMCCPEEI